MDLAMLEIAQDRHGQNYHIVGARRNAHAAVQKVYLDSFVSQYRDREGTGAQYTAFTCVWFCSQRPDTPTVVAPSPALCRWPPARGPSFSGPSSLFAIFDGKMGYTYKESQGAPSLSCLPELGPSKLTLWPFWLILVWTNGMGGGLLGPVPTTWGGVYTWTGTTSKIVVPRQWGPARAPPRCRCSRSRPPS